MDKWEFVLVFMLVLIGAGVTNILRGIGLTLRKSHKVRHYLVHYVWLTVLLFTYLAVFFSSFGDQGTEYDFWDFSSNFVSYSLLFLLTFLAYPDSGPGDEIDLKAHFLETHRSYFILWALVWAIPVLYSLISSEESLSEGGLWWPLLYLVISVIGVLVKGERAHALLALSIVLAIGFQLIY